MHSLILHVLGVFFVLHMCVLVHAYDEEAYPFESSKINRPTYQRKLQARRKGPVMPAKGWEMCCEAEFQVVPNMEHSYVWPMETPERNYFVVSGTIFCKIYTCCALHCAFSSHGYHVLVTFFYDFNPYKMHTAPSLVL